MDRDRRFSDAPRASSAIVRTPNQQAQESASVNFPATVPSGKREMFQLICFNRIPPLTRGFGVGPNSRAETSELHPFVDRRIYFVSLDLIRSPALSTASHAQGYRLIRIKSPSFVSFVCFVPLRHASDTRITPVAEQPERGRWCRFWCRLVMYFGALWCAVVTK
jgi:hypothetical protein